MCVELVTPSVDFDAEEGEVEKEYAASGLFPWMPLTDDEDIKVNPDWIVSFTTPKEDILNSIKKGWVMNPKDIVDNFGKWII